MGALRGWIVMSWMMLPGVMFGGSLLLRRLTAGDPDAFQATWIRAFHAHGGVVIKMSILYYILVPKGRDEAALPYTMAWVRHRDRYDESAVG